VCIESLNLHKFLVIILFYPTHGKWNDLSSLLLGMEKVDREERNSEENH
jgi:hypothetical protein